MNNTIGEIHLVCEGTIFKLSIFLGSKLERSHPQCKGHPLLTLGLCTLEPTRQDFPVSDILFLRMTSCLYLHDATCMFNIACCFPTMTETKWATFAMCLLHVD